MKRRAQTLSPALWATAIFLAAPASSWAQDGDWPMWRHDARRTARQTLPGEIDVPTVSSTVPMGGNHSPDRLILADVNLDGTSEAVMIRGGRVVARHPDGSLVWATDPIGAGWLLSATDFDGDGRPEVFASSTYEGIFAIDGTTGATVWRTPDRDARYAADIFPIDVEGDGRLELYVPDRGTSMNGRGTGSVYRFPSGLSGDWTVTELDTTAHGYWGGLGHDVGDLDGDGTLEVVTLSHDRVVVYALGTGSPLFTSEDLDAFPYGIGFVSVADIDGDGLDEAVVASNNPGGRYPTSRRLLVLEVDGGGLTLRWSFDVDGVEGNHLFPRRVVANVIPGGSLEIATSAFEPADGWRTIVFPGDAVIAEPIVELVGSVLLALADLDDDGIDELITRDADEAVFSPFGMIRVFEISDGDPSDPIELWSVNAAELAVEQSSWFVSNGPVRLGPSGSPLRPVMLTRDLNGDERPEHVVAIDADGTMIAERAVSRPYIGALRSCQDGCTAAAARYDGTVEFLDSDLTVSNDAVAPVGAADLIEPNYLLASTVVTSTSGVPVTIVADADGVFRAYEFSSGRAVERWSLPDFSSSSARSAMAMEIEGRADPVVAMVVRGSTGGVELRIHDVASSAEIMATEVSDSREAYVYNAFTPLNGATGVVHAIAAATRDGRDDEIEYLHVQVPTGESSLLPLTWIGTGSGDGLAAAFDLTGDGADELLVSQGSTLNVVDGETRDLFLSRASVATSGRIAGLAIVDTNDDGVEEILAAGPLGIGLFDQVLEPIWQVAGGGFNVGAAALDSSGAQVIASTTQSEALLKILAADDGAVLHSVCLAGGELWPDEESARAAGVTPGALTSVMVARELSGPGADSILVGSTDGFIYTVSADDGSLDWALNLRASVGEPIAADVDGDGLSEVVVGVGDGTVQVVDGASLPAPAAVYDTDGTFVAAGPEDDLDEILSGQMAGASWPAVGGATSYEYQLLLDDEVVVVPWTSAGTATNVVYDDLVLQLGQRYATVVRARSTEGARERVSVEISSDGFVVVDPSAPVVSVDASPSPFYPERTAPEDLATVRVNLIDEVGLLRYGVSIFRPGEPALFEMGPFEIGGTSFADEHRWDGRDRDGALVETGRYVVQATAVDVAGNEGTGSVEIYVCTSFGVDVEALCEDPGVDAGPDGDADLDVDGDVDAGSDADADSDFEVELDADPESDGDEESDADSDGALWQARGGGCSCTFSSASARSDLLRALLSFAIR